MPLIAIRILHRDAATLVDHAFRHRGAFCIAPQNLVEFAAVVTRSRFVAPAMSGVEVAQVAGMLYRSRTLTKIYPKRATVARAVTEGARLGVSGPAWYDLFLAVTMADNGVERRGYREYSRLSQVPVRDRPTAC